MNDNFTPDEREDDAAEEYFWHKFDMAWDTFAERMATAGFKPYKRVASKTDEPYSLKNGDMIITYDNDHQKLAFDFKDGNIVYRADPSTFRQYVVVGYIYELVAQGLGEAFSDYTNVISKLRDL